MFYLPVIASSEYASFQRPLQDHIPAAYDKWLKLQAMWHHHCLAERMEIRSVHVSPREFAQHLKATGRPANLKELLAFAEITANGKAH
jgi:hypothetical protein